MTVVIFIVISIFFIFQYKGIKKLERNVENSYYELDNALQKRYDLVPELIEQMEQQSKIQQELVQMVVKLRSFSGTIRNTKRGKWENEFTQILEKAIQEIKHKNTIEDLEKKYAQIQQKIKMTNVYYNVSAKEYNQKISKFPKNILASLTKKTKKPILEIQP